MDGTYDKQDKDALKQMLTMRQGQLEQMKEEDELIRNALADPMNDHPVAGLLTELNKRRVAVMDEASKGGFGIIHWMGDVSNSRAMQQPQLYGPQKGMTERERLTLYVAEQEKRVELMTPHCHLEIPVSQ